MPNMKAALPNVGACDQRRKVWLTPTTRLSSSNAAKTRNLLKFARVPQMREQLQISAATGLKFTILRKHVRKTLLFSKFFFPIVDVA